MPSGPRHGTSSPPPPTPSASSWATPDATHPIQPPLSPVAPPPSPPGTATLAQSHPTPAPHPLSRPLVPNTQNPPPPPPTNPYLTHPPVASGQITADLAHLLAEINFARNTGKVRRNTTKARILTAQETSDAIEEAEDRAARREAQALARRDREQQRAEDTSPAATSSTLPGGSRPSRRMSLGAAPATSSGLPIAGPSTPLAPSCASHGPRLPAPSGTPSPTSLSAQDHQHHPPSSGGQADEPSTSGCGLRGSRISSSPSQTSNQACVTLSSSSSSSAGPTTSAGHTAGKRRQEPTVWRCGRCRKPDPPESSEGLVSWVQCDNCHKWFHIICGSWSWTTMIMTFGVIGV
ncbi:uncharacterized protein LOC144542555 [Centroberyx gerrardi]